MIKKLVIVIILGLIALFLQGMFLPLFLGDHYSPNLVTVLVVFIAMNYRDQQGLFLMFVLGLLVDLAFAELLGLWPSAYVTVFVVLLLLSQHLFVESRMVVFLAVFACSIITEVAYLTGSGRLASVDLNFTFQLIVTTTLAGVFGVFIFPWLQKIIPSVDGRRRY